MLPKTFEASRPGAVAMLTLMVALGHMSIGMYLPSMPSMAKALDAPADRIQLTLTVFVLGFAVSQLVWGPVADRFGRRAALLTGLLVFGAAGAACAAASTVEELIVYRFLQAFGACSGQVVSRAIVRDTTEGAETARVMSYIAMAMSLSPAITPSVGGQLELWFGWRSNFVLLALVGFGLAALVALRLPETNPAARLDALAPGPMLRTYGMLLRDRGYLGYVLSIGFVFGSLMAYQTGAPFVLMRDLGWSPQSYGLLILITVLGFLAGSFLASRLTARYGIRQMVVVGTLTVLAGSGLMLVPALVGHLSTLAILGPMMLFSLGMGLAMPPSFAGALQGFPRVAGSASALMGCCQMGIGAAGSYAASHVGGSLHLAMTVVVAGCAVVAVLALFALVPPGGDGAARIS